MAPSRDSIPAALRRLEGAAVELQRTAAAAHAKLKAAVARENQRRLHLLATKLERAGIGWCREGSHFRPAVTIQLWFFRTSYLDQPIKDGYVMPICGGCLDSLIRRYPDGDYVRSRYFAVRVVGDGLEYRRPNRHWQPVPRGEPNVPELYTPKRITTTMAERFGVLPTIRLDYRSAPPKVVPDLEPHQPIKRPYRP